MTENIKVIQSEFRTLVFNAVKEGLDFIKSQDLSKCFLAGYTNWAVISWMKSGFPSFQDPTFDKGPTDYKNVFEGFMPLKPAKEFKSFQELLSYIEGNEFLKQRIYGPIMESGESLERFFFEFYAFRFPLVMIDRYIHIYNTFEFSEDSLLPIYETVARTLFQDKFIVNFCIPILFLKFGFDQLELGKEMVIQKMDEKFQLARGPMKSYGPSVHRVVSSSATHMLMLKNWVFKNQNIQFINILGSDIKSYPVNYIDNFFASLRAITKYDTGYAQLLISPKDWAITYQADLPPLNGTLIRAYPNKFERSFWLKDEFPEMNKKTALEVGDLFLKLVDMEQNSLKVATRRLNTCFNRDDEEDLVLDACIALEALLLGENEKQELTHRLAMRMAALNRFYKINSKSPTDIYEDIKKIYKYRSAIVHGSTKAHTKREIVLEDKRKIQTSDLAIDYLRMAIRVLVNNPSYLKSELIDKELLLNSCKWVRKNGS